jgi:ankyrin repeat protein
MTACAEGNLELVNRIASKFDSIQELCETEPSSGYTPLMMAARHGHLEVVEALIRLGHDRAETSRVRPYSLFVTLQAALRDKLKGGEFR